MTQLLEGTPHETPSAAWAKAFIAAQAEMPEIAKSKKATIPTKTGGGYAYSYADLPSIIDAVRPVLSKHGLAFAQSVETTESHGISVTTRIYHTEGGSQSFGPLVLPGGNDARGAGSAITYGRRYALCAALGIAADEDDDARTATNRSQTSEEGASTRKGEGSGLVSPGDTTPSSDSTQAPEGGETDASSPSGAPSDQALDLLAAYTLGAIIKAGARVGIEIKSKAQVESLGDEEAGRVAAELRGGA